MVRIGFIGCGVISGLHVKSLLDVPGAEIVALADVMPENIANLKALYPTLADVTEYRDYHEMLPTVDAALVLTPHHLHYRTSKTASRRACMCSPKSPLSPIRNRHRS